MNRFLGNFDCGWSQAKQQYLSCGSACRKIGKSLGELVKGKRLVNHWMDAALIYQRGNLSELPPARLGQEPEVCNAILAARRVYFPGHEIHYEATDWASTYLVRHLFVWGTRDRDNRTPWLANLKRGQGRLSAQCVEDYVVDTTVRPVVLSVIRDNFVRTKTRHQVNVPTAGGGCYMETETFCELNRKGTHAAGPSLN